MRGEAWLTLAVVLATIAILGSERLSAPFTVLGAVTFLLVAGVVDADQALSGFSNPAPITVAALYVLAAGADATGALERITGRLLGPDEHRAADDRRGLARILFPVAAASGFLTNTTLVAVIAPRIVTWTRQTGQSPSRYLMPLSFAVILGGTLTLVGTSTNIVVSGLLEESGAQPLDFFEIGRVGLPVAFAGLILLIALAPRLLPSRRAPSDDLLADVREFTVEMTVAPGSPLTGLSVSEAGLRSLEGVFLVEVEREGRRISPVAPHELLTEGDRLIFAGNVRRILDLQRVPGLISVEDRHFSIVSSGPRRRLYEVVVAEAAPLADSTLKATGFRAKYGAAVLAIHRAGQRLAGKLGELQVRQGDVLLLVADADFRERWLNSSDFLVIAPLGGEVPPRREKATPAGLVLLGFVVAVASGVLDILPAGLLAAFALVALGVLSPVEARRAVDLNVVVLIAASFGLGAAVAASGLAGELGSALTGTFGGLGDRGLLAGVIIATLLLTELITNNAAAVLMFPIAVAAATESGLDPRPFAIAVALAASASFLTPIGYQTNTMVYGIGGYRFWDFARLGLPLTVLVLLLAVLVIPLAWPLQR
ncbi:MAG: SLC13 family permease [Dehalococcoidia bacterium]